MFDKILIANRGEIACRVARTARRLGVRTVAIYSDADAQAMHVAACDEAYRIGPAPARESYLRGDAIIEIAKRTQAQAIHPGYGFLSENAPFAAACEAAGVIFIGPPARAIAAMGSKSEAKRIMSAAGVPVVPGYHGEDQDRERLRTAADAIGYPVLIKAVAGGGGKGMRVVERGTDFATALASAQREAKSSFRDDRVLLEKYLVEPRHIEVQVFADTRGQVIHLLERDCSVQRRHQKVLEEAPAPGVTAERRASLGQAAVAAARSIGYVGAGTVEFIVPRSFVQDGEFFFMEMNTRLQVEHPVTEMVTGTDLVEWQLRVAAGEALPLSQGDVVPRGHAIEARIYAEDPRRGFLPSVGRLTHLRFPTETGEVRVDTGVREGDAISPHYDPMIAKLIVHGVDRPEALKKLAGALAECEVVGVATNLAFLRRIVRQGAFARGEVHTGLIAVHEAELFAAMPLPEGHVLAALALAEWHSFAAPPPGEAMRGNDVFSPWRRTDGWWLNSESHAVRLDYREDARPISIAMRSAATAETGTDGAMTQGSSWKISVDRGTPIAATLLEVAGDMFTIATSEGVHRARIVASDGERHVFCDGKARRFDRVEVLGDGGAHEVPEGHLRAPMSGMVIAVLVQAGQRVARGAPLLILEAMKMEHTIVAPAEGTVVKVNFAAGDRVHEGADLVDVDVGE
ncbi:MAG: acetyl/propionyl/methylcrotonyl-CoA carboxylase subunit alpha [Pseudomonadota bacterium]|nr:acetyl/propionyl/methylcrotonyl-CoA carboxylase subunit alpha [Pseudomonadota bacterium]